MKMRAFLILALLTPFAHTLAFASEDTAEFFAPIPSIDDTFNTPDASDYSVSETSENPDLLRQIMASVKNHGAWAFKFVLVKPTGDIQTLTQYRENALTPPASTMKLFTSWMAYQKNKMDKATLTHMLKTSNNHEANQALALSGGFRAYGQFYKNSIHLGPINFKAIDGDGYSHSNRVTAQLEIDLLLMILKSADYDEYKNFLATPHDGISTLAEEHRFTEFTDPLFAKTGTLTGTQSLAGYTELSEGTLVFSMLSSPTAHYTEGTTAGRNTIDDAVRAHVYAIKAQTLREAAAAAIEHTDPIDN